MIKVKHLKTGRLYDLLGKSKMKVNGEWVDSYTYGGIDKTTGEYTYFTRDKENFESHFKEYFEDGVYPIVVSCKNGIIENFTADSKMIIECPLFLSKDQRDCSKFTVPWQKERFDPKTLKLYDRVLVRDEHKYSWASAYFYHIKEDSDYPYMTTRSAYRYCIPYNNDTKHLDGRKEQAPEYYKYWED